MSAIKKVVYETRFTKPVGTTGASQYHNDPFFIKKLEKAKKRLANVTFPIEVKK